MSQNWLRTCTLSASGSSGSGGSVTGGGPTDLRVRFNIESHTLQAPDQACFIITNPGQQTVAAFQQEFATVMFTAGYEDNPDGLIFKGSIIQSQYGEIENLTDRLLRVWCANSDLAYNQAHVNSTLAAGSTPQNIVDTCLQSLGQFGVTLGQIVGVDLSQPTFPRAYPLSGMARDFLREVALSKNATFSINNDLLNMFGKNAASSSTGIQVNANTGMVGTAISTIEGVKVKMLINSAVQVNSNIQLDPSTLISPVFSGTVPLQTNAQDQIKEFSNQINASGQYRVLHILHEGDTRGGEWFQTLTCIGAGQQLNNTQVGLGYQ